MTGSRRVAMEYAPRVSNPYVSRVDAGTVELVRACGVEVVSSGDLIQQFEATWDDDQWRMHREAEKVTRSAYDLAFGLIAERVRAAADDPRDRGPVGDHGPFPPQRPDDLQPADRRRSDRTAATPITSRSPARTRRSARATSC